MNGVECEKGERKKKRKKKKKGKENIFFNINY